MSLALTADPALAGQATALARTVVDHAREAGDSGETARLLGNAAMAFNLLGDAVIAAEAAAECLVAADASLGQDDSGPAVALAVYTLTDIGRVADALAGLSSLKGERGNAALLCGIGKRLAQRGRTADLQRLVSDQNGLPSISGAYERICALTGLGRVFAETGDPDLAEAASDMIEKASELAGELTLDYEKAVTLAGQAGLLAVLGRRREAAEYARRALEAAREPIGGWRGQVVTEAVEALIRSDQIEDAAQAATCAPPDQRAECIVTVARALFDAGRHDRAAGMITEEIAAVRAAGLRQAFYDLICTHLPKHPDLLRAWIGGRAEITQITTALTAIERWWT